MTESNNYMQRINLTSKEDIREYIIVKRLIEREMRKPPQEMDVDLVDECFAYMQDLTGEGAGLDAAALDAKYREVLTAATSKRQQRAPARRFSKRNIRKFFIILAATLLLLLGTLTIVAKQLGYRNAWDFVTQKVNEIFDLNLGDTIEEDGITLIVDEQHTIYGSIDELLKAEQLNILYPHSLPKGVNVRSVYKTAHVNEQFSMFLRFNSLDMSIVIKNYYTADFSSNKDLAPFETEIAIFYIKKLETGEFQGMCQHNGFEYLITCKDYNTLTHIMENMKGIEP
ncbi:MAG: hypothetical protein IJY16_09095 [Clostridia bacterium]|nr:hypothetical protein [Clostridia bacterium]